MRADVPSLVTSSGSLSKHVSKRRSSAENSPSKPKRVRGISPTPSIDPLAAPSDIILLPGPPPKRRHPDSPPRRRNPLKEMRQVSLDRSPSPAPLVSLPSSAPAPETFDFRGTKRIREELAKRGTFLPFNIQQTPLVGAVNPAYGEINTMLRNLHFDRMKRIFNTGQLLATREEKEEEEEEEDVEMQL
eukprot:TRINITY_DN44440_c0_g4_i3.p1 TRINITY_DN44440_c0_g4~~TRINITY_DN44440_c0_g4_i3.p1  ORF type:complete len:188 (+),score=3.17 TRINITY_DN44440_c0_g4_i3:89-652(+)